jgi:hypothetical protein
MWYGLPYPSIVGIPWCMCTHPIDYMGVHLLRCTHDNECTWTHDAICNTFVAITWDVSFHVEHKQLHVIPSTTFNSFRRRINIVFTKYGIYTIVDIIIANPTRVDLLLQSCATWKFVVFETTQAKEKNYFDQHPTNQFLPLTIEVFGCLNKHVDIYLHVMPMPCGTSKSQRVFLIMSWLHLLVKKIQLHYKGCKHLPF